MLRNRKYTGKYYCGDRLCENTFPPIIDEKLYEKVQETLSKNQYFAGAQSAKQEYLLSGKAYCGVCKSSLVADSGTSKSGATYYYYACSNRKKNRACDKKNEKKDFIEWYIVEQTVNYLSNPQRVDLIAADIVAYYDNRTSENEIKRIKTDKKRIEQEIDNAVNYMIKGVTTDVLKTLDDKIVELTKQLNDLKNYQEELELEQKLKITKKHITDFIAEYIKGELHDKSQRKRLI